MAINPKATAQIGVALGTHVTDRREEVTGGFEKMHAGRGYKAPSIPSNTHQSGSQKKHG